MFACFFIDKCFDGACSAYAFARFHRECIDTGARCSFHGDSCIRAPAACS